MSERLIAAAEAAIAKAPDQTGPFLPLVREAVATLGWKTMTYRCDTCHFEWEVWSSLGVEGPQALRDAGLYVATPFMLGSCPAWPVNPDATADERASFQHLERCQGRMGHVRRPTDREFEPRLIPDHCPRFVLDHWHESAALVIPEPALVRARRFHNEKEG